MPLRPINLTHPVNKRHPLNVGLVAWWLGLRQWSGGGMWFDLCRNANGTLTNGPSWRASDRPGGHRVLSFDGSNDYVTATAPAALSSIGTTGAVAVAMWAKIPVAAATSRFLMATTSGAAASGIDILYGLGGASGALTFRLGGGNPVTHSGGYNDNLWHHIVGSRTGNQITLYVNGVSVATAGNSNNASSSGPLQLGARNGANFAQFTGDDLRIWNRDLSAGEVAELYRESRSGYPRMLNRVRRPQGWPSQASGRLLALRRRAVA